MLPNTNNEKIDELGSAKQAINLRRSFPLAHRSILARSAKWLLIYFLALFIFVLAHWATTDGFTLEGAAKVYRLIFGTVLFGGFLLCVGKLIYEFFYHIAYSYGIETTHLVISKGVFLKTRGSFPLAQITDVYLHRQTSDLIFGLYRFQILTPSAGSISTASATAGSIPLASIEGFAKSTAVKFQDYLTGLLDAAHPTTEAAAPPHPAEEVPSPTSQ